MAKHAYLIIAQDNFKILENLLLLLDDDRNDIFLHVHKKNKDFDTDYFIQLLTKSKLYIYSEFYTFPAYESMINCELFLLNEAIKRDTYEYYHYLSGCSLPLKDQDYIHSFFQKNMGKEFIHFDDDYLEHTKHIKYYVSLYHLFQKKHCYNITFLNKLFLWIKKFFLFIQVILKIDRQRGSYLDLKYGSNFFSITHNLALYISSKSNDIKSFSSKSYCSDNFAIQTFVYNSPFIKNLYMTNQKYASLMNMHEFKLNHSFDDCTHYIWNFSDFDYLSITPCLFASQFCESDLKIVYNICNMITTKSFLKNFPKNKNNP